MQDIEERPLTIPEDDGELPHLNANGKKTTIVIWTPSQFLKTKKGNCLTFVIITVSILAIVLGFVFLNLVKIEREAFTHNEENPNEIPKTGGDGTTKDPLMRNPWEHSPSPKFQVDDPLFYDEDVPDETTKSTEKITTTSNQNDDVITQKNETVMEGQSNATCVTPECFEMVAAVQSSMNMAVDPCHNFYDYSCGRWGENNPIPSRLNAWDVLGQVGVETLKTVKNALENGHMANEAERKAKRFYKSCMKYYEEPSYNFVPWRLKINSSVTEDDDDDDYDTDTNSTDDFNWGALKFQEQLQILHHQFDTQSLFKWSVIHDPGNFSRRIIELTKGRIDWNANELDFTSDAHEKKYMTRVGRLFGMTNKTMIRVMMKEVHNFGKEIHELSLKTEQKNRPRLMSLIDLEKLCNVINWQEYFNSAFSKINHSLQKDEKIILVSSPSYLHALSELIQDKRLSEKGEIILRNFLTWHGSQMNTEKLSHLYTSTSYQREHWYSCVLRMKTDLSWVLTSIFIRASKSIDPRHQVGKLVKNVRFEILDMLKHLELIDEETKILAQEKAKETQDMIGYPGFLLNDDKMEEMYANLIIDTDDYLVNSRRVSAFALMEKLKTIDPNFAQGWIVAPYITNAFFVVQHNKMVVPFGIIQRPYYDKEFPKSINYGALGAIIGHEIVHGYDSHGSFYDVDRNLHNWRAEAKTDKFTKQTQCLIDQFNEQYINGMTVDGKATFDENVADSVGLKAAYHAYRKREDKDFHLPSFDVTHDQLFFIAFSQIWCANIKEGTSAKTQYGIHSPDPLRVLVTLQNMEEFSQAFNCPIESGMNPKDKCVMW